jgi:lycopene cyclase domain-containing protein
MKTLYLLVVFSAVIVPFLFSFHRNIKFHKTFRAFFIAVSIVGIVFIVWDAIFTQLGVWNFNPRYVTGIYIYNLPVEEILFFIFIPFSCVFTYFCLDKFYNLSWNQKAEMAFCVLLSLGLLVIGIIFLDRLYTSVTFISAALVCLWLKFIVKVNWFGKAITVYGILLIPFCIVNGILTGTGPDEAVVRYNNAENLGIRLLTIPIEDTFYGLELILLNIFFYKKMQQKSGS